mmetsp:Transcript_24990/g.58982  ORF Transcript_24990/g.58982 Transcript_24990/m.58982 type:complete len:225 (-) Transcript_24990:903-1577(-)
MNGTVETHRSIRSRCNRFALRLWHFGRSLQRRNDVGANQKTVGCGPNKAVDTIHDSTVFGDQIPKVFQIGIALQHGRRQVSYQTEQGQDCSVKGARYQKVRPFLCPGTRDRKQRARNASTDHSLHRLVGRRRSCGGGYLAELRFSELSSHEVRTDIGERQTNPRPKDKDGATGDWQVDQCLWYQKSEFVKQITPHGCSYGEQSGRFHHRGTHGSYPHPKAGNVS